MDFRSGESVAVRCSNGEIRRNVVWAEGERVLYVCSERQFRALRAGEAAAPPIGFLYSDVEAVNDKSEASSVAARH